MMVGGRGRCGRNRKECLQFNIITVWCFLIGFFFSFLFLGVTHRVNLTLNLCCLSLRNWKKIRSLSIDRLIDFWKVCISIDCYLDFFFFKSNQSKTFSIFSILIYFRLTVNTTSVTHTAAMFFFGPPLSSSHNYFRVVFSLFACLFLSI